MKTARSIVTTLLLAVAAIPSLAMSADNVILLLDNSGSMRTNDAGRLVPEAVSEFVSALDGDTHVAIVTFDARARLLQPLSPAASFDATILDNLDYRGTLTDPALAVERGLYELREHRNPEGPNTDSMVLITDGMLDLGNTTENLRAEDWLLNGLAGDLTDRGIGVWAVALTENADFRLLSQLTTKTGGDYYRAQTAENVSAAIARIQGDLAARTPGPQAAWGEFSSAYDGAQGSRIAPSDRAGAGMATAAPAPQMRRSPAVSSSAPVVAAPAPAPIAAASQPTTETGVTSSEANLRVWLAAALLAAGLGMLLWVAIVTLRGRKEDALLTPVASEYFPECYLVDLQGVTDRPTHLLSGKYNIVTRLQNPPNDGINYIQVFRRQIGRRHALIEYRDFSFWVTDQNSVNGTWVNGERKLGETRLKHGDRLRFHNYEFEFCVSDLAFSNETLMAAKKKQGLNPDYS